jgi:putative NADPH-quinone reductase
MEISGESIRMRLSEERRVEGGREMKVLAITGNPRKSGALATLHEEAARGAADGGAEVEMVRLADLDIRPCRFCMHCHGDLSPRIASCVQPDDMRELLEKIDAADGFILSCPASSGHANALMKTFDERCVWTLGRPTGRVLWVKGVPESRIADKPRFAATLTTAGTVPAWSRAFCDGQTREMAALARGIFGARITGRLYVGRLNLRKLNRRDQRRAYRLGRTLAAAARDGQA